MPETDQPDDFVEPIDPQQPNEQREDYLVRVERSRIRDLEARAQRGDDAEARAQAAERRLAFAEAGIDLSSEDEKVRFFVEGWQGELDPAAIRAKAEAFGVLAPAGTTAPAAETAPAEQPVDTPLEPGEADQTAERRALAASAPPDNAPPADPYKVAADVHQRVLADGGQEKHALGGAINSLVNAAARGDQRVILDPRSGARPGPGT